MHRFVAVTGYLQAAVMTAMLSRFDYSVYDDDSAIPLCDLSVSVVNFSCIGAEVMC